MACGPCGSLGGLMRTLRRARRPAAAGHGAPLLPLLRGAAGGHGAAGRGGSGPRRRRWGRRAVAWALVMAGCLAAAAALLPLGAPRPPLFIASTAILASGRRALVAMSSVPSACGGALPAFEGATRAEKMDDAGILSNLLETRGWRNIDMGGGGNCLFLSIAPQVSAEDAAAACERSGRPQSDVREWDSLPLLERARVLRRLAIADEEAFIAAVAELRSSGAALTEYQRWRVVEYFKDMAEEFVSSGITELAEGVPRWNTHAVYQKVRELARDTPEDGMLDFVLKHAEEYMRITGQDGNWAGSSEMAALSRSLDRPFHAFGNDGVSREIVELGDVGGGEWRVLPYFVAMPPSGAGGEPVRIFQRNGGGHYQLLG